MTMIEKVSAGIQAAHKNFMATGAGRDTDERWPDMARAALEAMREPSLKMVEVGWDEVNRSAGGAVLTAWKVMIDAALSGK